MSKSAYLYTALVALAAALLLLNLSWVELAVFTTRDFAGLCVFVALAILSEAMATDFAVGSNRTVTSSIAFVPLFACILVFPPAAATIAAVFVEGFAEVFLRKRVLWRAVFNCSQWALGIGIASLTYEFLGGDYSTSDIHVIAFAVIPVSAFATNFLVVGGLYAVRQQRPFTIILRQIIGPAGGNFLYDLFASPFVIVAVVLYSELYVGGLLLIVLPLLLIRFSYISKLQLEQANQDLLRVLIKAIETRDPYTSGHSVRVSSLARAIADGIGLRGSRVAQIETAALLHDIGKIDVLYAPLIGKTAALDQDERDVIRTHATKGAEMLRTLTSLNEEVVRGVRHHHERYDGRGYPDRLVGKTIPIASRIIMLCDSIDAMLSDRPYRRALTVEQARTELRRCAGTQFDPDIVAFVLEQEILERAAQLAPQESSAKERATVAATA